MAEEVVDELHHDVYRVVIPVLVSLGIAANALCLLVFTRPALRAMNVNWCFVAIAASDLLLFLFTIPVITTIGGCTFSSYGEAYYFSHFARNLIGICHVFNTYMMVWLSFDRFIAVWKYEMYPRIQQQPNVKRNRLLGSAAASVVFFLFYMVMRDVRCDPEVEGDEDCEHGRWVSFIGNRDKSNENWIKVYRVVHAIITRWLPECLLVFFDASLILGVIQGRVHLPRCRQTQGRSWERNVIILTIAITFCHFLFNLPLTVYFIGYGASADDHCSSNYSRAVLFAVAYIFFLLQHTVHIAIHIGFNTRFRMELKNLLQMEKLEEDGSGLPEGCEATSQESAGVEVGHKNEPELMCMPPSLHSTTPNRSNLSQDQDANMEDISMS